MLCGAACGSIKCAGTTASQWVGQSEARRRMLRMRGTSVLFEDVLQKNNECHEERKRSQGMIVPVPQSEVSRISIKTFSQCSKRKAWSNLSWISRS